jgi:hypothetical protein
MSSSKFLKKTGKIVLYIFLGVLVLAGAMFIFINTSAGKKMVRNQVQRFLHKKLQTTVAIGTVDYSFPKWLEITGVYIEDQHKDTLVYGERLAVDLDMWELIGGDVDIRKIDLENIRIHLGRSATDSNFNYQFVVDAFSDPQTNGATAVDTAALQLTLKQLLLHRIYLQFNDAYAGNVFSAGITNLDLTLNKFQPDRYIFDIDRFKADSLDFVMEMVEPGFHSPGSDTLPAALFPVLLTANDAVFRQVNISVNDKVTGMQYSNKVSFLSGQDLAVDLKKQSAAVSAIRLDSSSAVFIAAKPVTATATGAANYSWKVAAGKVIMNGNRFQYDDPALKPSSGLDYAHLLANNIDLDASNVFYSVDSSAVLVHQFKFKDKSGFRVDSSHATINYTSYGITTRDLYIKTPGTLLRNDLQMTFAGLDKVLAEPASTKLNAKFTRSIIAMNDIYALAPFIEQWLPGSQFRNTTLRLNTEVTGTLQRLHIPYLQLSGLSATVINAKATLFNITDPNRLTYDITLFNSSMSQKDMARFIPAGYEEILAKLPPGIRFGTRLRGDMRNANATVNLNSKPLDFDGDVGIKNFSETKNLRYDVKIRNSRIDKSFLLSVIDTSLIPANIRLPQQVLASGSVSGDMNNIRTNLSLGGSYGNATATGYVHNFKNTETATYDMEIGGNNFSLGSLLKQDTLLGKISFKGLLKGKGFNYKTMQSTMRGDIGNIDYNNYNYKNIGVKATFDRGNLQSTGNIDDPSIVLNYEATANLAAAYPRFTAALNVDTVKLKNLHFYKDTLNLKFRSYIQASNLDPYNLDVYALVDSGRVFYNNRTFVLDSIIATAASQDRVNNISLRSPFVDANAKGRFDYNTIGPAIIQYVDHYYNISDSIKTGNADQQVAFDGIIKSHPLVLEMVKGLSAYENLVFNGSYASDYGDSALRLSANTPFIRYENYSIRNAALSLKAMNEHLEYSAAFDTLNLGQTPLFKTSLHGAIANDTVALIASAFDAGNIPRYIVGGTLYSKGNDFSFSISDSMLLNYEKWNVSPKNNIGYSRLGILVSDFVLTNDSASITASSQRKIPNSPIDIRIKNFDIRDITTALNQDTLLAEGLINAEINVGEFSKALPAFTGSFSVTGLKVMQSPVGNISLFATRQSQNAISGSVRLTENNNDVSVTGVYYLNNEQQQFDAVVDMKKLSLATLQGFSNGYMTRASGGMHGVVALKGKFTQPEWKGDINFDTARFTVSSLGTTYTLNKEQIVFDYPQIRFKDFTIRDTLNNPFIVNGNIRSRSLMEYDLAVDLNSRDFTLVNAPKAIDNFIYGYAAIDANVSVTGTSELPVIEGDVYINEKSDVTMVLPEKNIDKDAAKSLVRFIDRDTFALPETGEFRPAVAAPVNFARFLNYNLNLQVDKEAAFTIVIDPSTGDELKVLGDAQLNAGVDPGGNIIIAGNYVLNSGYYVLNYQFLSKKFNLIKGSTIYFAGAPMDAQIDMTAEYIANTSPKELLGNEVGSVDPRLANTFKQKIPFRVILYLKGSLKKPSISFDIQLPEEGAISTNLRNTIDNKLVQLREDMAATNKQVFALLALGRFVGEQSTDFFKGTGSGGGFNDLARESVSKFLSAALDQIASDLFKGINIDLNLNSYKDFTNSDGTQRTDLNVEVSKNFLNDRLNVTVGKNFGIEGQDGSAKAAQQKGSRFLPDVTVNYKLSQDGKYMIRAYNKNQFEVILDGYVVETGLAFIVTLDYDMFKELFIRKKAAN